MDSPGTPAGHVSWGGPSPKQGSHRATGTTGHVPAVHEGGECWPAQSVSYPNAVVTIAVKGKTMSTLVTVLFIVSFFLPVDEKNVCSG